MDYRILLRRTIILLLVLLLTGCGTATMASPPATQIPIAASPSPTAAPPTKASEPPPLGTLTMSPSGCTLDLAEDTVTPGAYAIEVINEMGVPGAVFDMWTILPERTYEGFAEQIEEAKVMAKTKSDEELSLRNLPPPQGVENWRRFGVEGRSQTIYKYLNSGTYAIVCQDFIDPAGWWPVYIAGPIEVE